MKERRERLEKLVEFLCSPLCGGRRTASREIEAARGQIIDELSAIGLKPIEQQVPASRGINVIARLPGSGVLADRAILVAAHYDHLGWAKKGVAYWGADDNAAGVGIMLDVARHLYQRPVSGDRREVIFIAFDAEEPPFFLSNGMGSMHFVRQPILPLAQIDCMICMDLVGHAVGATDLPDSIRESLFVLGAEKTHQLGAILDQRIAAAKTLVRPRRMNADVIPALSDYHAFEQAHVPFLFLSCGRWQHYHTVHDTPEKLDYAKCLAIAGWLAELVTDLSSRPGRLIYDAALRDDRTSLDTLSAIARELGRRHPGREQLERGVMMLRAKLSPEGALCTEDQELLSMLVAGVEETLASS